MLFVCVPVGSSYPNIQERLPVSQQKVVNYLLKNLHNKKCICILDERATGDHKILWPKVKVWDEKFMLSSFFTDNFTNFLSFYFFSVTRGYKISFSFFVFIIAMRLKK